jgi:DNA-binding transcriptional LysR family regulator
MAIFARVVEAGSFSRAAETLGVSKSAVSKQVARLEDRLGARLLNRTTRRLSLTEAGTAFYEGCRHVVDEAEAAEAAVTHLAQAARGTLHVNAPMTFGQQHVAPAMPDFLRQYPDLAVDLQLNDRTVDLVDEGFDVAIRVGELSDSTLIARRLAPLQTVICAAPSYLAERGRPERPEDLKAHDCLIYSYLTSGRNWRFQGPEGPIRVGVDGRLEANNGDALLSAARAGAGIAALPTFICGDDLRAGRLVALLSEWLDRSPGGVYAVYPANRNVSPKVRVFIDFLAARFGAAPYWDEGLT